jgi:hypothetical protein
MERQRDFLKNIGVSSGDNIDGNLVPSEAPVTVLQGAAGHCGRYGLVL